MNYKEAQKKNEAAQNILSDSQTTPAKIRSLTALLGGINPKLDVLLKEVNGAISHVEKIEKMQVIELTIEALPEMTPKDKRRKKALILLLKFWGDLKGEVARVQKEFAQAHEHPQHGNVRAFGNITGAAKGPLGVITLIAVGIVALNSISVPVTIVNDGCDPIVPVTSVSINIPGLRLPDQPIPPGGSATAMLPPIPLRVDGTKRDSLVLSGFKQQYAFYMDSSGIDILYNGRSLIGKETDIKLTRDTKQELIIRCR